MTGLPMHVGRFGDLCILYILTLQIDIVLDQPRLVLCML